MNNPGRKLILLFLCLALAILFAGCGSGGSSGKSTQKATTTLKTSGLVTGGMLVGDLEVVISIPYGVTVELDPLTNQPAKSVVQLVGTTDPAMTMKALDYVAPLPPPSPNGSPTNGSLRIVYLAATGFNPADAILIQLDIATGFFPVASDFSLTKFEVGTMSADGSTINTPTPVPDPVFTVTIT